MLGFRLLPWEYGVRNLLRRPGRSALTLAGLALVVLLVFVVVGFVRGLEATLAVSGDPRVVLIHALGGGENVENSSIPGRTAPLLAASLQGVQRRHGAVYASPELYLGTRVTPEGGGPPAMGVVRGVTPATIRVRRRVQVVEGSWPKAGEVLVGRLAAAKLGRAAEDLAVGRTLTIEGRAWRVSGHFVAVGSALESELWCPLETLQQAMKRQDLSLVAVTLAPGAEFQAVDEFCRERLDLELQATAETDYYAALQKHYRPVVALAIGCGTGLLLGVVGALPPALKALRLPVVEGLKAV
ncbi:MAG: ABC transporter permease [Gemmataceae bacterium]|nr:ABC transporter permease [Gemmataceae bacterium]